jgi:hypothetical protein
MRDGLCVVTDDAVLVITSGNGPGEGANHQLAFAQREIRQPIGAMRCRSCLNVPDGPSAVGARYGMPSLVVRNGTGVGSAVGSDLRLYCSAEARDLALIESRKRIGARQEGRLAVAVGAADHAARS